MHRGETTTFLFPLSGAQLPFLLDYFFFPPKFEAAATGQPGAVAFGRAEGRFWQRGAALRGWMRRRAMLSHLPKPQKWNFCFAFKANTAQIWSLASAIDPAWTEMPLRVLHPGPVLVCDPL